MAIRLPFGLPITVDPRESIGSSLVALNTIDLPVAEAVWRLLDRGECTADIGANIGYMTAVMAARLRSGGVVHAFEPLPEITYWLREHVHVWRRQTAAEIHVHEIALAEQGGTAALHVPAEFAANRGIASLRPAAETALHRTVTVRCGTLDRHFSDSEAPRLLKVDVEGCEARVFRGAERLLSRRLLRDIVFEEFGPSSAESIRILATHGYTVFRLTRGVLRLQLRAVGAMFRPSLDLPCYLATTDPARAQARFRPVGWQVLKRRA